MATEYTHLELGQDYATGISGYYVPQQEVKLKYGSREVLYVIGQAVVDSSCCGTANCQYAMVPGYIIRWQPEMNKDGLPVSEVELISDKATRNNIRKIIKETEHVSQIEFW